MLRSLAIININFIKIGLQTCAMVLQNQVAHVWNSMFTKSMLVIVKLCSVMFEVLNMQFSHYGRSERNITLSEAIIHLTVLRYMTLLYTSSDASFRLNTHEPKHNTGHDILAATQFWIGCMYNKHISGL